METVVVSEKALREFIKDALDSNHLGDLTTPETPPVNVNPVVDKIAAETDPTNLKFVPQDRIEFNVAVNDMIKDVPVEKIPGIYKIITKAVDSDKKGKNMKNVQQDDSAKVEEAIRKEVRRMLSEITPSFSGYEFGSDDDDDDDPRPKGKKLNVVGDVGGSTFEEIAKELGFSVAGAKQAVDKALLKMRFLMNMDPEEREIMTLTAMGDYIKMLNKSGELSPADVQLLKDHPDMVRDLDGFRQFLANKIRRARKDAPQVIDPLSDDSAAAPSAEVPPGVDPAVVPADVAAATPAAAPAAAKKPAKPAKPAKGPKSAYKIYGRNGPTPVHTRIKGRVFRPTGDSRFQNGDRASIAFSDPDTISVKDDQSGHTQSWKGEAFTRRIDKIIAEVNKD